jgi:ferric-dicitrate binding protein FerR (iron transport regulator)
MTEPSNKSPSGAEDDEIERLLTAALRTNPLSDDAMDRLREAASGEWARLSGHKTLTRFLRRRVWAAAAALLVCIALGAIGYGWPLAHPKVFGVVARVEGGGGEVTAGWFHHRPLKVGITLDSGEELISRGPVLVSLSSGATLRVAPGTVLKLVAETQATLRQGMIYLDFPPNARSLALDINTQVGTLEHVGTAYEVFSNDQLVRVRVRAGQVRLWSRSAVTLLESGMQLTASRDGRATLNRIEAYGQDWSWAEALAPDYEIEGQPLLDFLQWVAREAGRPVKFSDAHAREIAEHTILHGSVKGRDPMDALRVVLSTTSLRYDIRGDTIWIQSGSGA